MVKVKINEIKKAIRKRDKERRLKKAAECESKGDVLQCKGFFTKAAKSTRKRLNSRRIVVLRLKQVLS